MKSAQKNPKNKKDFHSRKSIIEKDIRDFLILFCLLNKNQFLLDMTDNKV